MRFLGIISIVRWPRNEGLFGMISQTDRNTKNTLTHSVLFNMVDAVRNSSDPDLVPTQSQTKCQNGFNEGALDFEAYFILDRTIEAYTHASRIVSVRPKVSVLGIF